MNNDQTRSNNRRVFMEPKVPQHFLRAVRDIFDYPMSEERFYVALTWSHRHLSPQSPMPTPLCWLISAENLDSARVCSQIVRNILDGMLMEQVNGQMGPHEFEAIRRMLLKRVRLLSIREAHFVLDDLGIPVYNNTSFHKVEDIILVPFDTDVGFSQSNVASYVGQIPSYVVEFVDV